MKTIKIETTEAVRRFNAQLEIADIALALAAVDVTDPRKILSLLNVAGHHELAETFKESGRDVGYFHGYTASPPKFETKSEVFFDGHMEKERWMIGLQRIAYRGRAQDQTWQDAFEMCQLIAREALRAV